MPTEQFQLSHADAAVRNPLAVLNADPTYKIPGTRDRVFLTDLPELLQGNKGTLSEVRKTIREKNEDREEPRHPAYVKRKKEWQRMQKASQEKTLPPESAAPFAVLDCYVQDFPESLRAREDLEESWQQLYDLLPKLEKAMREAAALPPAPQPVVREDSERRTRVVDLPTVGDIKAFLQAVQKALPDPAIPSGKKKKSKTAAEPTAARAHYTEAKDLLELISALKKYLAVLGDRLAMEDAYLGFDEGLQDTHRAISMANHPDRNPGDKEAEQRFKEGNVAYRKIANVSGEARDQFTHALVLGDTTAWSPETLAILKDVTAMFAPVFANELPPPPGDPCPACKGHGSLQHQDVNDFIPVARVCETCKGSGTIPAFVTELRLALEQSIAPGKKKKRK